MVVDSVECEFAKKMNSSFSGILGFSVTKYGKINLLIVSVHLGWYNQISWIRYLINNKSLFLRVPEYRKSEIKTLAGAVSDKDFFLVHKRPSSHCILTWWEGWRSSLESPLQGHLQSHSWGFHLYDYFTSQGPYLQLSFCILSLNRWILGAHKLSVYSSKCTFNFIRNCQTFSKMIMPFCFPTSNEWEFQMLPILSRTS